MFRTDRITRLCDENGNTLDKKEFLKRKPFGFHAIRHLTATSLYLLGVTMEIIMEILRHHSIQTTKRYLKRMGLNELKPALDLLPETGQPKVKFIEMRKAPHATPRDEKDFSKVM